MEEGADAWYRDGARELFLGSRAGEDWKKVDDICDVWFDSGSTHAFVLEDRQHFPQLGHIVRKVDGGADTVMYLEGSDQHRGWFQSSLLESSGTRGRAPYDIVLTHGFTLDENGRAMSKSLGNGVEPQKVMKDSGADILRLWVCATDYADDQRIGPEILKNTVETYRKLRNSIRWMLGTLAHFGPNDEVADTEMPELERLMLHRLSEIDAEVREAYTNFDYKTVVASLSNFMNADLSAFYFDIRKDALYCDPVSSMTRKAALTTVDILCDAILKWLAPVISFTAEEGWLMYRPGGCPSVHLLPFPHDLAGYRNDGLAAKWETIRNVRRVVTGAIELERAAKKMGSSLEASPIVYVTDRAILALLFDVDLAEVCITSNYEVREGEAPADAFTLPDVKGVAVVVEKAVGTKCARSWKILTTVGEDPEYPDVSPRDAQALREWKALTGSEEPVSPGEVPTEPVEPIEKQPAEPESSSERVSDEPGSKSGKTDTRRTKKAVETKGPGKAKKETEAKKAAEAKKARDKKAAEAKKANAKKEAEAKKAAEAKEAAKSKKDAEARKAAKVKRTSGGGKGANSNKASSAPKRPKGKSEKAKKKKTSKKAGKKAPAKSVKKTSAKKKKKAR
jgi:isoleucyl-tRNA synthetase